MMLSRINLALSAWRGGGGVTIPPPIINNVSVPFGRITYQGKGTVNLNSPTLGLVDAASGAITSWSYSGGTGTNVGTYFSTTTEAAAGRTPSHTPSGIFQSAGTYTWTVTATGPGGSDTCTLTYVVQADACIIGLDTVNFPDQIFGCTANQFYTLVNGRRVLLAVGLEDGTPIPLGTGFTFGSGNTVVFTYADPARPTILQYFTIGGSDATLDGLIVGAYTTGTISGQIQLSAMTRGIVKNLSMIGTEANFVQTSSGGSVLAGVFISTGCADCIIEDSTIVHKARGIWNDGGSNTIIRRTWIDKFHNQGVYMGTAANGVDFEDVWLTCPFRTQTPLDTGSHLDFIQLEDTTAGGVTAQNITGRKVAFVMGNANSGARGYAGSGGGAAGYVNGVVFDRFISLGWLPDMWEVYGIGGACSLTRGVVCRMLTGDDSTAPTNSKKDQGLASARLLFQPFAAGNLGPSAAMTLDKIYIENTFEDNATGTAVTTFGAIGVVEYSRAAMSGFLVANPKTTLEAYDWTGNPTLATYKSRVFAALGRADGNSPVNTLGTDWNT